MVLSAITLHLLIYFIPHYHYYNNNTNSITVNSYLYSTNTRLLQQTFRRSTIRMSSLLKTTTCTSSKPKHNISVHWFRNGLRLHDNTPLYEATQNSNYLLPLYIIDPSAPFAQTANRKAGDIRANFILESIRELDSKLKKLPSSSSSSSSSSNNTNNNSSRLAVFIGKPDEILPRILTKIGASALYYEREPAAPIREADGIVLRSIMEKDSLKNNVEICGYDTHTLHPMEHYLALCKDGVAPSTYGVFTKIFHKLGNVPDEIPDVVTIPPLPPNMDDLIELSSCTITNDLNCPSLEELGYDSKKLEFRSKGGIDFIGGEDAGLALLDRMMKRTQWVCTFEKPNTSPNALSVDTTGLSPYIKHGCVSPRRFYHELSKVYAKFPPDKLSQPPVSLHGQLMWREYNNLMGYTTPNFDCMIGNPVARNIPWDDDPLLLDAWRNSQTGYPFIDAIMTQLRLTGWIHHLARHAVACFLTRGDLWQSWEKGAAIFEEELIDADWSINNFNWQWLSCTAHFYQYFRCYSPVAFGKKTDKNGDYIRKWLPQFHSFPAKYIYEPWKAPHNIQASAGVIIGKDYPHPIVDHQSISKSNMSRMKQAYDAAKSSNSIVDAAENEEESSIAPSAKRKRRS